MALRRGIWFPEKWMNRPLPTRVLRKVFQSAEKWMKRAERWIKPRGAFLTHPSIRTLNGLAIAFCGFLLALPLPPGTNFPPALAIVLLAAGTLEEDGLFLLLGYLAVAMNFVFFTLLPILGLQGIRAMGGGF